MNRFQISKEHHRNKIEERHYENHTECHCVDPLAGPVVEPVQLKPECQCPGIFTVSYNEDNKCVCDCSEVESNECSRKKNGIEHFPITERK